MEKKHNHWYIAVIAATAGFVCGIVPSEAQNEASRSRASHIGGNIGVDLGDFRQSRNLRRDTLLGRGVRQSESKEYLQLLKDSDAYVRTEAARRLGIAEFRPADKILSERLIRQTSLRNNLMKQAKVSQYRVPAQTQVQTTPLSSSIRYKTMMALQKDYEAIEIPDMVLKVAIARIRSAKSVGVGKVDVFAKALKMDRASLALLIKQVNADPSGNRALEVREIVDGTVNLLYSVRLSGKVKSTLAAQLNLNDSQKMWVASSTMSPSQAAAKLVAYCSSLKVLRGEENRLIHRLEYSNLPLSAPLFSQLSKMRTDVGNYRKRPGARKMLWLAASLGEQRFEPLLKAMTSSRDPYLRDSAKKALRIYAYSVQLRRSRVKKLW